MAEVRGVISNGIYLNASSLRGARGFAAIQWVSLSVRGSKAALRAGFMTGLLRSARNDEPVKRLNSLLSRIRKDARHGGVNGGQGSLCRDRARGALYPPSPRQTLLYQIVQTHYPTFLAELASRERHLPDYVQHEFEDYLTCGRLEHGFLRIRCSDRHAERLSRSAVSAAGSVRVAARGGWRRVRRCWSMRVFHSCRFASRC